jgi:hypothetical protein
MSLEKTRDHAKARLRRLDLCGRCEQTTNRGGCPNCGSPQLGEEAAPGLADVGGKSFRCVADSLKHE